MLVTVGKFKRCYLYERRIGGRNVKRVMKEGVQIWPGANERIRKLVLAPPQPMDAEYPYWRHFDDGMDIGLYVDAYSGGQVIIGYEDQRTVKTEEERANLLQRGYVVISHIEGSMYLMGKPVYAEQGGGAEEGYTDVVVVFSPAMRDQYLAKGYVVIEETSKGSNLQFFWYKMGLPVGVVSGGGDEEAETRWGRVNIDGRTWYWKKDLVTKYELPYSLATWDGKGVLDFGEDGPYVGSLMEGDQLAVEVKMAARQDETLENTYDRDTKTKMWNKPILSGTTFKLKWQKGGKKDTAHEDFDIHGVPSKQVYMKGWGQANGHGRQEWHEEWLQASGQRVHDGWMQEFNNVWNAGDTAYEASLKSDIGAWYGELTPYYPAFMKTIHLTVLDILYND